MSKSTICFCFFLRNTTEVKRVVGEMWLTGVETHKQSDCSSIQHCNEMA